MADDILRISISRQDPNQAVWWRLLWNDRGFENWADVNGWFWDGYRAEIAKTKDGFEIRFRYEEDATLFRLMWT